MPFRYSIVIPVYCSEDIIATTVARTLSVIASNDLSAEIILVNDGSPDNSWNVIKKLAEENETVVAINLLRNYGQHNAIMCGFERARGEYAITMDDDLQNPPEEIPRLISKSEEDDYDLIFGRFKQKQHASYRRLGTIIIGYLNRKIFDKPRHIKLTNFRLIRRDLLNRILEHKTSYPYVPGLLLKYAGNIANTDVEHASRAVGQSNYGPRKIINLVSRLMINYSSYPLRLVSGIGLLVSLISFSVGSYFLIKGLLYGGNVAGWTSLFVLTSFLGGFTIALLALIGEYLSRILNQLSGEKTFYVKEIIE